MFGSSRVRRSSAPWISRPSQRARERIYRGRRAGPGGLAAAGALLVLAGCSGGGAEQLAEDYCEYLRAADGMAFEQRQEAIIELDRRLEEEGVRRSSLRAAMQRRCSAAILEHDGRMMGLLGEELREMREDIEQMR